MKTNGWRAVVPVLVAVVALLTLGACGEPLPSLPLSYFGASEHGPKSDLLLEAEDLPEGWTVVGTRDAVFDWRNAIPATESLEVWLSGPTGWQSARNRFVRFPNQEALFNWWPLVSMGRTEWDIPWERQVNLLNMEKMPRIHADQISHQCDDHEWDVTVCVVRMTYGSVLAELEVKSDQGVEGLTDSVYWLVAALDQKMQRTLLYRNGVGVHQHFLRPTRVRPPFWFGHLA